MRKLMAIEIVDLISWDALAVTRKNKKSLEAQNQKVIIDFDCFYLAMIAHIALGFSTRQTDMVPVFPWLLIIILMACSNPVTYAGLEFW